MLLYSLQSRCCNFFTNEDFYSDQTDRVMVSNFTDETSHYQALDWLPELSGLREKLLPLKPRLKVVHQVLARLREIDPIVSTAQPSQPWSRANRRFAGILSATGERTLAKRRGAGV